MDIDDFVACTREMIEGETSRIDQRLTWTLTIEGFLFAALAIAWDKDALLVNLICFLGVIFALWGMFAVSIAERAIAGLLADFERHPQRTEYTGPRIIGLAPSRSWVGPRLLVLFPAYVAFAWSAIFVVRAYANT